MNVVELEEGEQLWSVRQVASVVGCHKNTIYGWLRSGYFPKPLALGSLTRWKASEVRAWIDARHRRFEGKKT